MHHGLPPSLPGGLRTANGNKASAIVTMTHTLRSHGAPSCYNTYYVQISPRNLPPVLSFSGRGESETIHLA